MIFQLAKVGSRSASKSSGFVGFKPLNLNCKFISARNSFLASNLKKSNLISKANKATMAENGTSEYTPKQQRLVEMWEEHMRCEFAAKNVEETMVTMCSNPSVNHVPTMTGGTGYDDVAAFYGKYFIPQMPADTETVMVSRTVGNTQIVDEMIFKFTHDVPMAWMLPGVAPTGKKVEIPLVAIIGFEDEKVVFERIYWDQAGVLKQLGLLENADKLPVSGPESAKKVLDTTSVPCNTLIEK